MAGMFMPPPKPKTPKIMPPPAPDQGPVQAAAADARKRVALSKGRSSTILADGGLGKVGSAS